MNKRIKKPIFSTSEVFDVCVNNFRDDDIKMHYNSIRNIVIDNAIILDTNLSGKTAYLIAESGNLGVNPVTKEEISKLYNNKFVKKGTPGRKYYETIIQSAKNNICPNCGVGIVSTLDHYMPKSIYSVFSITPNNLYPCCRDCNTNKGSNKYSSYIDLPINSYYDNYNDNEWLEVDIVVQNKIPTFNYSVNEDVFENNNDFERVKNHCKTFKLFEKFSYLAISEFSNMRGYYQNFKEKNEPTGLYEYFNEVYKSNRINSVNNYKTAMYKSMAKHYIVIYCLL